jgi:hypothetical protein
VYDWVNPSLAQGLHPLGPGEGLGQEDHVGRLPLHLADDPLPEGERLGVRVVHPEGADAVADPEPEEVAAGIPEGPRSSHQKFSG